MPMNRSRKRSTESSEDYLEAILRIRSERGSCRNVDIACLLGYSKASVTQALAGLSAAAVISPIGEMGWEDQHVVGNGGKIGPLAQRLYDTLTGIQWGTRPDPFGWVVKL